MEQNKTEKQFANKLEFDDIWKEFNCPKYVTYHFPKTDKSPKGIFHFDNQLKANTTDILQKLNVLIFDPVTRDSVLRICRLLYDYLHETGNNGYKVKDLPLLINILKFLAENVQSVKEYELHLDKMLDLCNVPPLLEKSSEGFAMLDKMEQYFTLLGHLLIILPTKAQKLKIHTALHSLLLKPQVKAVASIKLEYSHKAMEKSMLPLTVVEVLQASFTEMYPKVLQLVFLLSSISSICSHRMVEVNVLNIILIRMDLPYATQLHCTRPPDSLLCGNEYSDDTIHLIMNTLWSLMKSVVFCKKMSQILKENPTPPHCVLWGLCYTFERQIYYSQYRNFHIKIRNEIAVIVLTILIAFPSWNLVSSGIADAVIKYLVGIETGSVRIFSEVVTFGRTAEDLYFEKILLLIVTHLVQNDACIFFMVKRKLMHTVLQIVNPNIAEIKITWKSSGFWDLWTHAMNALAVLAPKMPQQFIECDAITRLYMVLEWCLSVKVDINIVMTCIKTLCTIILSDNIYLLECFREYGTIILLIKLINYILKLDKITMKEQRILTLALISVERLMTKQTFYQEIYEEYSVTFIMELLFLCIYKKDQEFQIDQRLLLAIGSYIWECIVWCPKSLERFIQYGAIYIILDIIEIVPYCSRCLFLGILTDICDSTFCGSFLCTWRAIKKKTGLMSLLAEVWREEEIRIKIKRNVDGVLLDKKLPQMGKRQWFQTYCMKLDKDSSPAINDLIGSIRPKIYSICQIIDRDSERYKMAKERYKILHANLLKEDRITMSMIELYFTLKLGQVWIEIAMYFEQVGITPFGIDGQALFLMIQRYYLWGILITERQNRIIKSIKREEEIQEKDEYARIRDSKLILALDAFDELDYIYRTTDKSYLLKKKSEQIQQVNLALKFPHDSFDSHCHRTFQDKIIVTAIFNQHQTINTDLRVESYLNQTKDKVFPVSPWDSFLTDETCYYELPLASLSSTCFPRIQEFKENES